MTAADLHARAAELRAAAANIRAAAKAVRVEADETARAARKLQHQENQRRSPRVELREKVLAALATGPATTVEVQSRTGRSRSGAHLMVKLLLDEGAVELRGLRPPVKLWGHWEKVYQLTGWVGEYDMREAPSCAPKAPPKPPPKPKPPPPKAAMDDSVESDVLDSLRTLRAAHARDLAEHTGRELAEVYQALDRLREARRVALDRDAVTWRPNAGNPGVAA